MAEDQVIGSLKVNVGLDGTGFQNGVSNLNRQMRLVQSEFQLASAKLGGFGNSTEQLKLKGDSLTKQLELQQQKVSALQAAYQKSLVVKGADAKATQDLLIKLLQAQKQETELQNTLDRTNRELNQQSSAWHKLSTTISTVGERLKTVGEKISTAGRTLSAAVTAPLVGAGIAAVKFASDLDESTNKVNVAFKGSADEVKKWSEGTLEAYGIAKGTALDMAALFGDMGTAMGQAPAQAAKMSTSLVGLAGDLASFKNIGIGQAQDALKGIFTGEGEALKTLGIVMQDSTLQAYALATGQKKTYDQMTQAEKVALRYAFIMNATKNAQGDFARTSTGTANQLRIAEESLKELAASIGKVLLPVITPIVAKINEWVKAFAGLDDRTKKVVVVIAGIAAAIGPVLVIVGSLISSVGTIIGAFSAASGAIAATGGVVAIITGPIGIAIGAIAALAAAAYLIYQNWDSIKAEATKIWNAVKNSVIGAWEAIKTMTSEIWDGIKGFFKRWWPLMLAVFTGGLGLVVAYVIGHWDQIKKKTSAIWDSITGFFVKYWDRLKFAFGPVAVISTYVVQNWDKIKETTSTVFEAIRKAVGEKFSAVKETISSIVTAIKAIFDKTIGAAWNWGRNLIQEFIDGIKSKISAFIDTLEGISNEIKDFLGFSSPTKKGPGSKADKWAPNFMEMFVGGLQEYMPQLASKANEVAAKLNFTNEVAVNRLALAGAGGVTIQVSVSGNYLANSVDEDRLAQKISRKIALDFHNSIGGSF